jgi:hypothetical protein
VVPIIALPALAALGCGELGAPAITAIRDAAASAPDDQPTPDARVAPFGFDGWTGFPDVPPFEAGSGEKALVYAHSGSDLFSVDPESLQFSRVGPFLIHGATRDEYLNDVTDIAIDRNGRIVGTTFHDLLEIDGKTAACTRIAPLPPGRSFNGLSWIRTERGEEQLLATTLDGGVYRIDPVTGNATSVGGLGGGLRSSGDLVSVASYGTLVTVMTVGAASDQLARVDPATGVATVIGDTGFKKVWGLGFWKDRVFGFTQTGQFILIDPKTGAGKLVDTISAFPFWGAGVTTSVPVIE